MSLLNTISLLVSLVGFCLTHSSFASIDSVVVNFTRGAEPVQTERLGPFNRFVDLQKALARLGAIQVRSLHFDNITDADDDPTDLFTFVIRSVTLLADDCQLKASKGPEKVPSVDRFFSLAETTLSPVTETATTRTVNLRALISRRKPPEPAAEALVAAAASASLDMPVAIPVGSADMFALFQTLGVDYQPGLRFVRSLSQINSRAHELPGSRMLVAPKFLKQEFEGRMVVSRSTFPNSLKATIRYIPEIGGYGLFANDDFEQDIPLGIYGGEAHYRFPHTKKKPKFFIGDDLERTLSSQHPGVPISDYIGIHPELFYGSHLTTATVAMQMATPASGEFDVRYVSHLPFYPETNELSINARHFGNELRFINHGIESHQNAQFRAVLMDYTEFLCYSGYPVPTNIVAGQFFIPVTVVYVTKQVKKGQQFLIDYGPSYWKALKRQPIAL